MKNSISAAFIRSIRPRPGLAFHLTFVSPVSSYYCWSRSLQLNMEASKFRAEASDDDKLALECAEKTQHKSCSKPEWTAHQDRDTITPPIGTVAIIVDLRGNWGAVRIFQRSSNETVAMVGMEENKHLVIVPWQNDWYYFCTGTPRVGYVKG